MKCVGKFEASNGSPSTIVWQLRRVRIGTEPNVVRNPARLCQTSCGSGRVVIRACASEDRLAAEPDLEPSMYLYDDQEGDHRLMIRRKNL
jgi:hypothetical protein